MPVASAHTHPDKATNPSLPIVSPYILELERQLIERQSLARPSLSAAILADSNRFNRTKQSDVITSEGIPVLDTIGHEFDKPRGPLQGNGKVKMGSEHHINQPSIGSGLEITTFQALLDAVRAGKAESEHQNYKNYKNYNNPFASHDFSPPPNPLSMPAPSISSAPSSAPFPFYVRERATRAQTSDYATTPYPATQPPPSQFLPKTGQHPVPRASESYLKRRYISVGRCRIERSAQNAHEELKRRFEKPKPIFSWSLLWAAIAKCLHDFVLTVAYLAQVVFLIAEASIYLVINLWQKCLLATAALQDWIGKAAGEE